MKAKMTKATCLKLIRKIPGWEKARVIHIPGDPSVAVVKEQGKEIVLRHKGFTIKALMPALLAAVKELAKE
jgi:hypothetical protein